MSNRVKHRADVAAGAACPGCVTLAEQKRSPWHASYIDVLSTPSYFAEIEAKHAKATKRKGNPIMTNVEKSAYKRGEYVGYADGVWRIRKYAGGWRATHAEGKYADRLGATLQDISRELAAVVPPKSNPKHSGRPAGHKPGCGCVICARGKRRGNPIKRKGVTKTAYVKRASQITRRAPTKRLTKRREAMALLAGAGYTGVFPNPMPEIHVQQEGRANDWRTVARFPNTAEGKRNAVAYANVHAKYVKARVRVCRP